jgi:rRNA maturation endonuclease Nob1
MAAKKPTLYNLQNIPKVEKSELLTCAGCKRTFERKSGRVFICFFCGSTNEIGGVQSDAT